MAAPVRCRRRGWVLKNKATCVMDLASSGMAAVASEVYSEGAGMARDGGGWHATASH